MKISAPQCRAARGLLGWNTRQLAKNSGIAESTLRDFEKERHVPIARNMTRLIEVFETAGVEFTNGDKPGVRLKG